VPIHERLRREDEALRTGWAHRLTGAIGLMAAASVVIFLLAPWIGERFGGFDGATRALYVDLVRINCLAQVLFAASFAIGEILVANRGFAWYALAPILYTGGIVLGTVLLAEPFGIAGTSWGAVAGAAAHLGIRAAGTLRTSFRIRPAFDVRTAAFREFIRLMLPRMASHPVELLMLTWFTILATGLGPGSVSSFNFSSDYQVVPILLIGAPFSLAVFPTLSAAFADGDTLTFRVVLARNLLSVGLLTAGAAVALFALSGTLVEVLLGGGRFGPEDVERTTTVGPPSRCRSRLTPWPTRSRGLSCDPRYGAAGRLAVRRARRRGSGLVVPRGATRHRRHPTRVRRGRGRKGPRPRGIPGPPPASAPGGSSQPGGLTATVGTTEMNSPSRSG
jgi:peptidoglycan biosynthesis protein MviN/MurJ (putative lipid II flippase)